MDLAPFMAPATPFFVASNVQTLDIRLLPKIGYSDSIMVTRIAIGLGIAAALIPVSLLLGLPATKSIFVSALVGLLFIALASGMSKMIR